jgi:hypothetical protein
MGYSCYSVFQFGMYRRGSGSPLLKILDENPYFTLRPLRQALYSIHKNRIKGESVIEGFHAFV